MKPSIPVRRLIGNRDQKPISDPEKQRAGQSTDENMQKGSVGTETEKVTPQK